MKKTLLLLLVQFCMVLCFGQRNMSGLWEGKMVAGVEIKLVFNFSVDSNKNVQVTVELPEQGFKTSNNTVSISADSLKIQIRQINAVFAGRFVNDTLVSGVWKQGQVLNMTLRKIDKIEKIVRKQTPVPPFSYRSEDVEYYNTDKSIKYAGTITIPTGKGPFPAALLLTGSGQQNRDEEILGHKPFAVIADYLTKQGLIVLRVDDRGIGGTTGDAANATTADFAKDAAVGIDYLKAHNNVDKKKIGIIGHSEGGMTGPMVAANRNDIDFLILLAAPGVKITKVMEEQNMAVLSSAGLPKANVQAYTKLYSRLVEVVSNSANAAEARPKIEPILKQWMDTTAKLIIMQTTGILNDETKNNFLNSFSQIAESNWYKYFFKYDPTPALEKLSSKVLAINGSKDIQIISSTNLAGIEQALKKSKSKIYEVVEVPGLNHLFQTCKSCTVREYGELEETFSPKVLDIMGSWLKKNVLEK